MTGKQRLSAAETRRRMLDQAKGKAVQDQAALEAEILGTPAPATEEPPQQQVAPQSAPPASPTPAQTAAPPQPAPANSTPQQQPGAPAPQKVQAPRPQPQPVAPVEVAVDEPAGDTKYATSFEIPPDLHARVKRACRTRSGGDATFRQTEVLLAAFDHAYPRLPEIVAGLKASQQVESPLFGVRTIEAAPATSAMKRLQVRPTWKQHKTIHKLAEGYGLPAVALVRAVLNDYLPQPQPKQRQGGEKAQESEAEPADVS